MKFTTPIPKPPPAVDAVALSDWAHRFVAWLDLQQQGEEVPHNLFGSQFAYTSNGVKTLVTAPDTPKRRKIESLSLATDSVGAIVIDIILDKGGTNYVVRQVSLTLAAPYFLPKDIVLLLDADDEILEINIVTALAGPTVWVNVTFEEQE